MLRPAHLRQGERVPRPERHHRPRVAGRADAVRAGGRRDRLHRRHGLQFLSASSTSTCRPYPDAVRDYLADFASRYTAEARARAARGRRGAPACWSSARPSSTNTRYCEAIGKSGKEPVLASRFVSADRFGGGVLACANHLAAFVTDGGCVHACSAKAAMRKSSSASVLKPNVTPISRWKRPGSPTIVKKRFVEQYLSQKMFEVYRMNDAPLDAAANTELCQRLERILPEYDLVVVADYGHGMLSREAPLTYSAVRSRFLAVNTQSNAGQPRLQHDLEVPPGGLRLPRPAGSAPWRRATSN